MKRRAPTKLHALCTAGDLPSQSPRDGSGLSTISCGINMNCSNATVELQPYNQWTGRPSRDRLQTTEMDLQAYQHVPAFPSHTPARTTFHGRGTRQWCLQHGRGHAYDPIGKNTARNDYTARRCRTILHQCYVPEWIQSKVISRVLHVNLNGFSRHYAGGDGACVGFSLLALYENQAKAKQSHIADRIPDVLPDFSPNTVDKLVEYVFRKHGGSEK